MVIPKQSLCDFCGTCVSVCPTDAIDLGESKIRILHDKCIECLNCVQICPMEALEEADEE